jgi:hypothetical protein
LSREARDNQGMTDSARACLARLREMDTALEHMERELPDDVRSIGAAARKRVAVCVSRLTVEGAQPEELSDALQDISQMMDALTARLLFVPWDPPRPQLKS